MGVQIRTVVSVEASTRHGQIVVTAKGGTLNLKFQGKPLSTHVIEAIARSVAEIIDTESMRPKKVFEEAEGPSNSKGLPLHERLNMVLGEGNLLIGPLAQGCIERAGIRLVGQMVLQTEDEMLKSKKFGAKTIREFRDLLRDELGLKFGMKAGELHGWVPPDQRDK